MVHIYLEILHTHHPEVGKFCQNSGGVLGAYDPNPQIFLQATLHTKHRSTL